MARSTPAQNDRGPASSTVRSRQAAAHFSATGAALRSDRSAAIPPLDHARPEPGVGHRADDRHGTPVGGAEQGGRLHVGGEVAVGSKPEPVRGLH